MRSSAFFSQLARAASVGALLLCAVPLAHSAKPEPPSSTAAQAPSSTPGDAANTAPLLQEQVRLLNRLTWGATEASAWRMALEGPDAFIADQLKPGPASRSYGIQVAQRAGVPAAVIRHASRELSRLEAQGAPTPQLDLFAVGADDSEQLADLAPAPAEQSALHEQAAALREQLADIDPDSLSPREALDILYRLRTQYL